jgi:hypothetical protein
VCRHVLACRSLSGSAFFLGGLSLGLGDPGFGGCNDRGLESPMQFFALGVTDLPTVETAADFDGSHFGDEAGKSSNLVPIRIWREGKGWVGVSVGDGAALDWRRAAAVFPVPFGVGLGLRENWSDKVADILEAEVHPERPEVKERELDAFNVSRVRARGDVLLDSDVEGC